MKSGASTCGDVTGRERGEVRGGGGGKSKGQAAAYRVKTASARSPSSPWYLEIDISSIVSVQQAVRMKVKPSTTIMEVKKRLRKNVGYPLEFQRLYVGDEVEVKNHIRIIDLDGGSFEEGGEWTSEAAKLPVLVLKTRLPTSSTDDRGSINFYGVAPKSKTLFSLMVEAQAGFAQRFRPERQLGGSSGNYMLRNQFKDVIACFKPFDEEPRTPNNPRGEYVGVLGEMGLREGFRSGEGYLREVAAFVIDSGHFHGVPYTCLCEAVDDAFNGKRVPKKGSFQQFVDNDGVMSDFSSSHLPPDEVHKVGLLDLRIMNVDRNDGNLLVSWMSPSAASASGGDERRMVLTPIDHGYCLPSRLQVDPLDWCWYYWKQAKAPFSDKTKQYIENVDPDLDAKVLKRDLNVDDVSLRTMRITGRLMKIGVRGGLTLFEIAEMVAREDIDVPSRLEEIVTDAVRQTVDKYNRGSFSAGGSRSQTPAAAREGREMETLKHSGSIEHSSDEDTIRPAPPSPSFDTPYQSPVSLHAEREPLADVNVNDGFILGGRFAGGMLKIIDTYSDGRGGGRRGMDDEGGDDGVVSVAGSGSGSSDGDIKEKDASDEEVSMFARGAGAGGEAGSDGDDKGFSKGFSKGRESVSPTGDDVSSPTYCYSYSNESLSIWKSTHSERFFYSTLDRLLQEEVEGREKK